MNASEKELVYNLLKAASGNAYGYATKAFRAPMPDFSETTAKIPETSTEQLADKPSDISKTVHLSQIAEETSASTAEQKPVVTPVFQEVKSDSQNHNKITLEDINNKIARCTRCGLARTRNNVVPGTGVLNPLVLVIGEGPGEEEDRHGLPFVGKAGALLDKMLNAIHLDRKTNCYITNIVKCRPPQNRNPETEEQAACISFLEAQIQILKPKMILCMGKIAIEKLLNESVSINSQHGEFFKYNNIPVMPTYHPSALLRNENLKKPAWEDLKDFKRKLDEISNH